AELALLGDDPDRWTTAPQGGPLDRSGGRRDPAPDRLDERRLAGAVGSDHRVDLAGVDLEIGAPERDDRRVLDAQRRDTEEPHGHPLRWAIPSMDTAPTRIMPRAIICQYGGRFRMLKRLNTTPRSRAASNSP